MATIAYLRIEYIADYFWFLVILNTIRYAGGDEVWHSSRPIPTTFESMTVTDGRGVSPLTVESLGRG